MEARTVMQIPKGIKITETSNHPPFFMIGIVECIILFGYTARIIFTTKMHVFHCVV